MEPSGRIEFEQNDSEPTARLNHLCSDCLLREVDFHKFPDFPPEIALMIWKFALQRHRLISLFVVSGDYSNHHYPHSERYSAKNELGKIVCGGNYWLSVNGIHRLSPLLGVSHQSRKAALNFYRVQIPYKYGERRCLRLNPEFDFIQIELLGPPEILVDFVHDVKAYDPSGIGILNIGIGDAGDGEDDGLQLPMSMSSPKLGSLSECLCDQFPDPNDLPPLTLSSFTATLTNAWRIFFHHMVFNYDTWQMAGSVSRTNSSHRAEPLDSVEYLDIAESLERDESLDNDEDMNIAECRRMAAECANSLVPIYSTIEAFELVETDPESIDID